MFRVLLISFSLFYLIYSDINTIKNITQIGITFNNNYTIQCTNDQIDSLVYNIQSDKNNYNVEIFGVTSSGLKHYSQNCDINCYANYSLDSTTDCLILISYNGTLTISYIV